MQRPASFLAQDDYLVTQANYFSDFLQDVAIALYQPLVGPAALALYLSLWQEAHRHVALTERHPQTDLMALLDIDADQLYSARVRLEAVGLIKTYTTADARGRYYAYELYAPLSPERFFADDLLGLLLYDRVGDQQYQALVTRFTLTPVRRSEWQDVSKRFTDVYDVTNVLTPPAAVTTARTATAQKATPAVTLNQDATYDWSLLASMTANLGLARDALQANQAALFQLAQFYGLNEPTLARLIGVAADVTTGKLDMARLRRLAEQTYRKADAPAFQAKDAASVASTAPTVPVTSPAADQLSATDQQLIQQASSMAPRAFLERRKQAINAKMFPSGSEIAAVRKLVSRQVFPEATVNVLIDYILQTNDTVTDAFLNAIANSWLKAGVTTPASALAEIKAFKAKQANPGPRRNKRPQRAEKMPDWAKPDYQAPTATPSAAVAERLAKQRAEFEALQQKGGHNDETDA